MVDISVLNDYVIDISDFFVDFIKHEIERYGIDTVYKGYLKELDCSRISDTGLRMQQTVNHRYRHTISEYLYLIHTYFNDDEEKLQELLDLHKRNLDFEIEHPPVEYKKSKTKTTKVKPKQTSLDFGTNVPKESVRKQKEKLRTERLSKLTFKFNIAQ